MALRSDTLVASVNGGSGAAVRNAGPSRLAFGNLTLLFPEDAQPAPQLRLTVGEDDRGAYDRVAMAEPVRYSGKRAYIAR